MQNPTEKQNCILKPNCTSCITQCGYTPVSPSSVYYLQSPLGWPFTINCNDFNTTFTGSTFEYNVLRKMSGCADSKIYYRDSQQQ
jgi:hypothetical protein